MPDSCRALAALALCALAACTTYQSAPLDTATPAPDTPQRVSVDPRRMPLPELAAHRYDPSDGFDMTELAMLAVANNPDLKLTRDDLGIAQAQAFAAGLLPDPQLNLGGAVPAPRSPGLTSAFSYGLTIDIMALLNRSNNKRSAAANVTKTDLALLWQEWQVVAQARQLFVKRRYQEELLPLLEAQRDAAQQRYARMAQATAAGNLTQDALSAALLTWQDAEKQANDAARQRVQIERDLHALLGLAAGAQITLVGTPDEAPLADAVVRNALAALPRRRPDLLALEAGYQAQEARYRAAIFAQFPALTIGFVRARDTSDIYTNGLQINVNLPIFNRNRGNIAIEQATRQRLRHEYANRLDQARLDVETLRTDAQVLGAALARAQAAQVTLERAARQAESAFARHDLALGPYTDARLAALGKRIEVLNLREALLEQRMGLQALLGSAVPDAYTPDQNAMDKNVEIPSSR